MLAMPTTIDRHGNHVSLLNRLHQQTLEREGRTFTIAFRLNEHGRLAFSTIIPVLYTNVCLLDGYTVIQDMAWDTWSEARDAEIQLWAISQ
jgi:hypothetical protein